MAAGESDIGDSPLGLQLARAGRGEVPVPDGSIRVSGQRQLCLHGEIFAVCEMGRSALDDHHSRLDRAGDQPGSERQTALAALDHFSGTGRSDSHCDSALTVSPSARAALDSVDRVLCILPRQTCAAAGVAARHDIVALCCNRLDSFARTVVSMPSQVSRSPRRVRRFGGCLSKAQPPRRLGTNARSPAAKVPEFSGWSKAIDAGSGGAGSPSARAARGCSSSSSSSLDPTPLRARRTERSEIASRRVGA